MTAGAGEWAIDLKYVEKTYKGKVRALRGIEMRVRRGEVFGLLGPNGAGKSTLVKILMTVIRATRAEGGMLGHPVGHKGTLGRVGYLPEHHRFPEYLTGAQVVDFYGALAGVPARERRARTPRLLELVGMGEWAKVKVKGYSKGMRQRVGIAQALINEPELVLLDEPTDGVDPVGRRDIREIIARLRGEGKTVFINSHILSELEQVCDRVAILVQGRVASQGTLEELTSGKRWLEVEAEGSGALEAGARAVRAGVKVEVGGTVARVYVDDAREIQGVIDGVRAAGGVIRGVRAVRPSLEDLFMEAVRDPATGREYLPGASRGAGGGG